MMGFCRVCGRALEESDCIGWRYFEMICGGCFLPFAGYILENIEGLEATVKAYNNAPGALGEA